MKFTSVDIIYNPNSTGPSDKYAKELRKGLTQLYSKLPTHLRATKYAGHAEKLAYTAAQSSARPLIISASGDGGYNEVINGAMKAQQKGAKPVCAILATGNANDHSRTLSDKPLLELIKKQEPKSIDLLKVTVKTGKKVEERFAHSYAGFGLTPVVAAELNKVSLNAIKESWIVAKTFYKYRPFKIVHNDKPLKLDSIIFANINQMAKVLTLSEKTKLNDGKFEIIITRHSHKFRLLKKLTKAAISNIEASEQYETYSFKTKKRMPAQLDGEVLGVPKNSEVTVDSIKQALRTYMD